MPVSPGMFGLGGTAGIIVDLVFTSIFTICLLTFVVIFASVFNLVVLSDIYSIPNSLSYTVSIKLVLILSFILVNK